MELYDHLKKREAEGNPIRVGLVGCGQMGSGLVHVTRRMEGLETFAVSDIDTSRPKKVFESLGIQPDMIHVTNSLSEAEDALRKGKYLITEDALLLPQLEGLDSVIDATGITDIGAKVAWTGIMHGKAVVMLNVETDVTVGVLLDRVARKTGSVYTVAAGDEPAVCKMLYDFSKTMGFEVVCLGKGKNNPINYDITPEMARAEAESKGMNPKMLASFIDGTKTMVEMAAVSNATGLTPDIPGMHGPKVEIEDLKKVFIPKSDGGILSRKGCVDYSTGKVAPGVFAIVATDEPRIINDMKFVSMGPGPYFMFFRPFHLCNIETPIAAAEAVIYKERTVTAKEMYSEVVPHSKRDIKAGETVGSIGSADFYNKIYTYKEAREKKAVPMGLTAGGKAIKDIKKGEMFTEDNFAPDASTFVYKLRKMQDAMYENERQA
ncbi:MAG: NAD(P)-dependent oxidoreductase [Eubacteriales bacterium]|nr:NAD(P)-dependent oxidoreductase [Eubacteriales bacterium]